MHNLLLRSSSICLLFVNSCIVFMFFSLLKPVQHLLTPALKTGAVCPLQSKLESKTDQTRALGDLHL